MITRKIGARGQITIPKQIREKENLRKGDEVKIREQGGEIVVEKTDKKEELKKAYIEMAERDKRIAEEWSEASKEANKYL